MKNIIKKCLCKFVISFNSFFFSFDETNLILILYNKSPFINNNKAFPSISFLAASTSLSTSNTSTTRRIVNVIRSDISSITSFNQTPSNNITIYNKDGFVKFENHRKFTIDPNEWTISQVGKFIRHLTNDFIT
ncbi:unnamed protein product [Rotaria sp. Silwood2]|nr:unnamed protein product [Rotaria sp. Silwood2]